jgi:hypothetical protein
MKKVGHAELGVIGDALRLVAERHMGLYSKRFANPNMSCASYQDEKSNRNLRLRWTCAPARGRINTGRVTHR